jgi:hypothetical protein
VGKKELLSAIIDPQIELRGFCNYKYVIHQIITRVTPIELVTMGMKVAQRLNRNAPTNDTEHNLTAGAKEYFHQCLNRNKYFNDKKKGVIRPKNTRSRTLEVAASLAVPDELFIDAKGAKAKGRFCSDGFVVEKGSQMVKQDAPSIKIDNKKLRDELITTSKVIDDGQFYTFVEDYTFASHCAACKAIWGRTENGRTKWRNSKGEKLEEIQRKLYDQNKKPPVIVHESSSSSVNQNCSLNEFASDPQEQPAAQDRRNRFRC